MSFVESVHDKIGLAFSIVGLVLVVPSVFLFKQYNRFLDHCQMVFLFWMTLAPAQTSFASHLKESWSKFVPNFLTFCQPGEIVCELGFALSWTICLLGVIMFLFLIVTFEKCKKPDLRFEPVYSTFKGFFKWTYVPLVYYSGYYLITDLNNGTRVNFLPSVVILGWCFAFPIIQLIYYKVIQQQKDNIWLKWFEFLGYARQFSIVVIFLLAQLVQVQTTMAKYFVYGPLVIYALLYLFKGIYINKVVERIIFGVQESIIIALFSLFLFSPDILVLYEIEFFGLAVVLLLNVIYITMRMVNWLVYGQLQEAVVNPELEDENSKVNQSYEALQPSLSRDFSPKKKNKFDDSNDILGSKESLNQSVRRGNQRRRR